MYAISSVAARPRRLALALPLFATLATLAACSDAVSPASTGSSAPDAVTALPRMSAGALAAARSGGASLLSGTDYNFYNVYVVPEGLAVTVFFKYTGNMTPIFTVGTTSDVYSSTEGWVAGKYLGEGKWQARVPGLLAHHKYHYRLENLGGGKSSGSFNTLKRQITVDIDWVQVHFDGDAGAPCGELTFRTRVQPGWYNGYAHDSYTKEYGICSGYGQGFIGADGKWT
jgi:hypothetical protein